MQSVKHQHYVPQFYLRNFCNEHGRIHVYDKKSGKSYETAPRNVAGERYFYDCEDLAEILGDKQGVEKYLSAQEGLISGYLNKLVDRLRTNNYIRLHPDTRTAIAAFSAFQLIRAKNARLESRQMSEQLVKFLSKHEDAGALIQEIKESTSEAEEKKAHCMRLLDLPFILELAGIISGHIWIIMKRHHGDSFWISDEPITKKENKSSPYRSNSGLASPGIEIHIPLSHDYLITCYEKNYFSNLKEMDGKVIDLASPQNIEYYRQFQVTSSSRFVYAKDSNFELAEEMCIADPSLRDPERKIITSNHDD